MNANPCKEVDVRTASQWLDSGQAVLVDVREPAEHASAHIAQATLLPLSKIQAAGLPAPSHDGKKLIVHCQGGGRSAKVARLWTDQGDAQVYSLAGGINAWKEAKLPTQQASRRPRLDVQRQLQMTIGLGVLAGVILGVWMSPWFLILPGLFGAGLTMAGLTGICPLAMLIARMPWNTRYDAACAPSADGAGSCRLPRQ